MREGERREREREAGRERRKRGGGGGGRDSEGVRERGVRTGREGERGGQ